MTALVLIIIYTGVLYFLVNRLGQIKKYPKKFDSVPGYEEYCKSIWHWPTYKPYGKATPPDSCSLPAGGAIWILAMFWYLFSEYLYSWFLVHGKGGECPFSPTYFSLLSSITIILFCFFWANYLPMFSKRPVAICHNLHCIFRKDSRSTAWEKMTKIALLATIIVFPLRVMMLYNYGYVDNEKLVYNPVFSFKEQVYEFDSINQIDVICSEDGSKVKHCYIYNEAGEKFDLAGSYSCVDDSQFEIVEYVVEHLPEDQKAQLQEYAIKRYIISWHR